MLFHTEESAEHLSAKMDKSTAHKKNLFSKTMLNTEN